MEAHVGSLIEPAVELGLEVELAYEAAARLEARLQVALQPLDHPLRLRILGLEEPPADPEYAAERREDLGRVAAAGVQRTLPVPNQRLREPAKPGEAAADPVQQVGRLLREDQRPGASPRVRQAANDHIATPRLAEADRDRPRRLPQTELA
jgi:hypothetical protein